MILVVIGSAILGYFRLWHSLRPMVASINAGIGEVIMTKFGNVWVARVVLSFILLVVSILGYIRLKNEHNKIAVSNKEITTIFVIGLATLATTSLIGHGAANGKLLPITIDFIHNLYASVWIGGVIYLALVVVPGIKKSTLLEEITKISLISIIIPRFSSSFPVVILGVIIITGPFLLYVLESNLGLTLASMYGKILIVKLLLAAIMIGIGGYNQ